MFTKFYIGLFFGLIQCAGFASSEDERARDLECAVCLAHVYQPQTPTIQFTMDQLLKWRQLGCNQQVETALVKGLMSCFSKHIMDQSEKVMDQYAKGHLFLFVDQSSQSTMDQLKVETIAQLWKRQQVETALVESLTSRFSKRIMDQSKKVMDQDAEGHLFLFVDQISQSTVDQYEKGRLFRCIDRISQSTMDQSKVETTAQLQKRLMDQSKKVMDQDAEGHLFLFVDQISQSTVDQYEKGRLFRCIDRISQSTMDQYAKCRHFLRVDQISQSTMDRYNEKYAAQIQRRTMGQLEEVETIAQFQKRIMDQLEEVETIQLQKRPMDPLEEVETIAPFLELVDQLVVETTAQLQTFVDQNEYSAKKQANQEPLKYWLKVSPPLVGSQSENQQIYAAGKKVIDLSQVANICLYAMKNIKLNALQGYDDGNKYDSNSLAEKVALSQIYDNKYSLILPIFDFTKKTSRGSSCNVIIENTERASNGRLR